MRKTDYPRQTVGLPQKIWDGLKEYKQREGFPTLVAALRSLVGEKLSEKLGRKYDGGGEGIRIVETVRDIEKSHGGGDG